MYLSFKWNRIIKLNVKSSGVRWQHHDTDTQNTRANNLWRAIVIVEIIKFPWLFVLKGKPLSLKGKFQVI